MSFLPFSSYSHDVYTIEGLLKVAFLDKVVEGRYEHGLVKLDSFSLLSSDAPVSDMFNYEIDRNKNIVNIRIPRSKRYYFNSSYRLFSGKEYCSDISSSGYTVRILNSINSEFNKIYVKHEWSCGSSGCSHNLILGNEEILNFCE